MHCICLPSAWPKATYDALSRKQSNLQVAIAATFMYTDARLHSKEVLDAIAAVWMDCNPWIQAILSGA